MRDKDITEYELEELIDLHRPIPRWKIALLKYQEWDGTQLAAGFENELAILERFLLRIRLDNLAFNKVIGALLSSKVVRVGFPTFFMYDIFLIIRSQKVETILYRLLHNLPASAKQCI